MTYDTDDPDLYPTFNDFQDVYQIPSEPPAVDPSTLVPLQVLYVGLPTSQPTGGVIPETMADAVTTKLITEEDKDPVSHFYRSHIPHATDWLCDVRCPSEPGSPVAKDNFTRGVGKLKLIYTNCVAW